MRVNHPLAVLSPLLLGVMGCATAFSPRSGSDTEHYHADTPAEIDAIASELADRAESRTSLGTARIQIGTLEAIEPRRSPYRQVALLERDLRATQATLRHELEMALGNRVNIVGEGAERATHVVEGEFLRTADSVDLSLRLVELKSDWIVATARRHIDDFVPEFYNRRLQAPSQFPRVMKEGSKAASADGAGTDEAGTRPRSRALKPVYPSDATMAGGAAEQVPDTADGADPFDGPIEFDRGPAAARLRASGELPPTSESSSPKE